MNISSKSSRKSVKIAYFVIFEVSYQMKLFWSIGSQPGRAVKTLIDIGKVPCEFTRINVLKRQHKSQWFLKMYPQGTIPVLVDENFVLGQSNAILIYLCQKHPSLLSYYGTDIFQRAKVNQQLSYYQNNFRIHMFKPFRRYLAFAYSGVHFYQDQKEQLWKNMIQGINDFQKYMNHEEKLFVAGNRVTIADLLYFYELTNLKYYKMGLEDYKWIKKWAERMEKIKEVQAIMKEWNSLALERAELFTNLRLPTR